MKVCIVTLFDSNNTSYQVKNFSYANVMDGRGSKQVLLKYQLACRKFAEKVWYLGVHTFVLNDLIKSDYQLHHGSPKLMSTQTM